MVIKQETNKKYHKRIREVIREFYTKVGPHCFICKSDVGLVCHKKDFKPHMRIANLSIGYLNKENVNDYIRLCYPCHYGVHWLHNKTNMTWEEIIKLFE